MGSSELSLLVAGTLTLWRMEARLRKAVCIPLKCEWSTAQGALQWKSSTSSQQLQPTISIPIASDGSLMRDRYHSCSLTVWSLVLSGGLPVLTTACLSMADLQLPDQVSPSDCYRCSVAFCHMCNICQMHLCCIVMHALNMLGGGAAGLIPGSRNAMATKIQC